MISDTLETVIELDDVGHTTVQLFADTRDINYPGIHWGVAKIKYEMGPISHLMFRIRDELGNHPEPHVRAHLEEQVNAKLKELVPGYYRQPVSVQGVDYHW